MKKQPTGAERNDTPSGAVFAALKKKLLRGAAQAKRGELVDPDSVLMKIERLKRRRAARRDG